MYIGRQTDRQVQIAREGERERESERERDGWIDRGREKESALRYRQIDGRDRRAYTNINNTMKYLNWLKLID